MQTKTNIDTIAGIVRLVGIGKIPALSFHLCDEATKFLWTPKLWRPHWNFQYCVFGWLIRTVPLISRVRTFGLLIPGQIEVQGLYWMWKRGGGDGCVRVWFLLPLAAWDQTSRQQNTGKYFVELKCFRLCSRSLQFKLMTEKVMLMVLTLMLGWIRRRRRLFDGPFIKRTLNQPRFSGIMVTIDQILTVRTRTETSQSNTL